MVELYKSAKPGSEIVKEYELTESSFRRWVRQHQESGFFKEKDNRSDEENKLLMLQKENQRLKMENDILKQAAQYFHYVKTMQTSPVASGKH